MKTVAIIQARMGSTRLPGKVMKTLCGRTVLAHVVNRVRACSLLDEIVVATTLSADDDVVAQEAVRCGAGVFRGSEDDVLSRYYCAAKECEAETVVRITSDCPLFDPDVLERMLRKFHTANLTDHHVDYLSNCLERTFPRGLDAEIFTFTALRKAHRGASQPFEREHVTPYIYQHPQEFSVELFRNDEDWSSHRWTLDTVEDFSLIEEIYSALYGKDEIFSTSSVLKLFESNHRLLLINSNVKQKTMEV